MGALLPGQTLVSMPVHRAWGQRRPFTVPNQAATSPLTIVGRPGFITMPALLVTVLKTSATAGERFLNYKVVRGNVTVIAAFGLHTTKASESATFSSVFMTPGSSPSVYSAESLYPLPCPLLEPGDELLLENGSAETGDEWTNIGGEVIEYEIPRDHPVAELAELARQLQEIGALLEHG